METQPFVFLGMPHHTRQVDIGAARGLYGTPCHPEKGPRCAPFDAKGSLLANAFNRLWCRALEYRDKHGFTHFAMIHSDVDPQMWWLSVLFEEMKRTGADLVSAVIPIKSGEGVTSTGLVDPRDPHKVVRRLTLREIHGKLPVTFNAANCHEAGLCDQEAILVVNTGLWLCDLRASWAEEVCFQVTDEVVKRRDPTSGEWHWYANTDPEDWAFSKWLHERGVRVAATRAVRVEHHGENAFSNDEWGNWETDHAWKAIRRTGVAHTEALAASIDLESSADFKFPDKVRGWLRRPEGFALRRLARGKRVLEIGSYCGKSTVCLADQAESVDCVDPFDGRGTEGGEGNTLDTFRETVRSRGLGDKIRVHLGTTAEVRDRFAGRQFDLVFIDGAHDRESVALDAEFALSVLAPGGALVFHDYRTYPGEFDDHWDPGVTEVVNDLIACGSRLEARYDTLAVVRPPAAVAAA